MGKDTPTFNSGPSSRTESLSRSVRNRRQDWAQRLLNQEGLTDRVVASLVSSNTGWGLLVVVLFAALCSITVVWTRDQPLVAIGRIMDETRLVRFPLSAEDQPLTARARETARQRTPRVYIADIAAIDSLSQSLENLPQALASVEKLADVDPTIRAQFSLTPELLTAVKAETSEGKPTQGWISKVNSLAAQLRRRPMLDQQTYQKSVQEGTNQYVRLLVGNEPLASVVRGDLINVEDKSLADVASAIARDAGFTGPGREIVANRLRFEPRPTFTFDEAATTTAQNEAALAVAPIIVENPVGQVIFQRGDTLSQAQHDLFSAEMRTYAQTASAWQRWGRIAGITAACIAITLALTGYTTLFNPRVRNKVSRIIGVAAILAAGLLVACIGTALSPQATAATATVPTIFVTMMLCIAYDRRSALAYGLLHGLLVCLALRESAGTMAVIIAGISCVVWTLREIRDRNSLFRTSIFSAVGMSIATTTFALIERPLVSGIERELLLDAAIAGAGTVIAGGVTLFILPQIERAFNVTTGLTLMELRDPKQPLLRELQQRAPGTYNHSLNVAAIAEAAAEAIGADSLLTYVGALYHDVGKMNKPEYFVENQNPGINRHDKLSPAMSLLIIVGHVKDGMELAREFRLPRNIQHFIEAHHGTTLVEFFFARAKKLAQQAALANARGLVPEPPEEEPYARELEEMEPSDVLLPDEFEYRYPGPKPRTREAAILMICDAVESATRTLGDPTPSRIETLVRTMATKRLMDGQFDDCELTLRDLNMIVDSISRTVSSMFHSRISYPDRAAS
jgi:cyclic-di-AMP phosphodiesterase PgpH